MLGVVGHGRIGHGRITPALKGRDPRQSAIRPTGTRVDGGGKSNRCAATTVDSPHLKSSYDGAAVRESTGLDLGRMLAAGISKRIGAELEEPGGRVSARHKASTVPSEV